MGDAENALPSSKKRAAGRELSRDNPGLDDEEDSPEQETGTFKRASDDVLAGRRIVKVRRGQTTSAPSSNPFAGIQLVPPTQSNVTTTEGKAEAQPAVEKPAPEDGNVKSDANKETEKGKDELEKQSESKVNEVEVESAADKEDASESAKPEDAVEKEGNVGEAAKPEVDGKQAAVEDKKEKDDKDNSESENADSGATSTPVNSFKQLSSSQNAFTGLTGTGFSSSTFSFGTISKDGSVLSGSSSSLFGAKTDGSSFSFGLSNNGNNTSLFGTSGTSVSSKTEGTTVPSLQEVPVETGEENEKAVFTADSVLFEFSESSWKERGKGELKVNVTTSGTEKARLVMRARGNYRLILNASLYPDMKLTNMEKRGITFACMNSAGEGKDSLSTFALKFRDASIVEEFRSAVTAHKGKTQTTTSLKTPENSPKASDD